jgi:hypothetical protein
LDAVGATSLLPTIVNDGTDRKLVLPQLLDVTASIDTAGFSCPARNRWARMESTFRRCAPKARLAIRGNNLDAEPVARGVQIRLSGLNASDLQRLDDLTELRPALDRSYAHIAFDLRFTDANTTEQTRLDLRRRACIRRGARADWVDWAGRDPVTGKAVKAGSIESALSSNIVDHSGGKRRAPNRNLALYKKSPTVLRVEIRFLHAETLRRYGLDRLQGILDLDPAEILHHHIGLRVFKPRFIPNEIAKSIARSRTPMWDAMAAERVSGFWHRQLCYHPSLVTRHGHITTIERLPITAPIAWTTAQIVHLAPWARTQIPLQ